MEVIDGLMFAAGVLGAVATCAGYARAYSAAGRGGRTASATLERTG